MSIKVNQLTKIFGEQKALDAISFEAKEGEILGFLGPNGAGKSTTMKIATTYLPPTKGHVEVCGLDVEVQPNKVRASIGYLPEHNPLYLEMYVREYLGFIGEVHGMRGKKLRTRIEEVIILCGLQKEHNKKIEALSKGYRQRVGLAQALIHDPKVLILDEPTTGLDPNQIIEIRKLIKSISKDKTVIFSTHIMQEVQALCDRVVVINNGKVVANDRIENLKSSDQSKVIIKVEFSEAVKVAALEAIEGVTAVEQKTEVAFVLTCVADRDIRPAIFKFATEEGVSLVGLSQEEVTMENIFQDLTKSEK